jgi:glycosyltransferase involved in cell wall biosynthesis
MSLGKPIIGTYGTSFEENIRNNENGFLVKPEDPKALSMKILSCLEIDNLEKIGQNAYRSVLGFDMEKIARETIEIYRHTTLHP